MDQNKEVIEMIMNMDPANKKCVDCDCPNVTFASINNGVTLCEACFVAHSTFGLNISYVRKLDDEWDNYLYDYFVYGGNSRFINNLKSFSMDHLMNSTEKYKTLACDSYRKRLKAKVLKLKAEDDIDRAMGKEQMNMDNNKKEDNDSNEFANYTVKSPLKITTMTKMQGFFFGKLSRSIEEMDLMDKIKSGSQKTWENMKKGGQFVAEKTKPATEKIKQGASYVSDQVKNVYTGAKDKITKKEVTNSSVSSS